MFNPTGQERGDPDVGTCLLELVHEGDEDGVCGLGALLLGYPEPLLHRVEPTCPNPNRIKTLTNKDAIGNEPDEEREGVSHSSTPRGARASAARRRAAGRAAAPWRAPTRSPSEAADAQARARPGFGG